MATWLTCLLPLHPQGGSRGVPRPVVRAPDEQKQIPVVIALAPASHCPPSCARLRVSGMFMFGGEGDLAPSRQSGAPLDRWGDDLAAPFECSLVSPLPRGVESQVHGLGRSLIVEALHASLLLLHSAGAGVSA